MSVFNHFIAVISSGLFGSTEERQNIKITPKIETEDIELGNVSRRLIEIHQKENYAECEFKSIIQNPDLELGFGPIVEINCGNIIIDITAVLKNVGYIENYISFMESVSYLTNPFKDRSNIFFKDVYPSWNNKLIHSEFHVVMHIETESMGVRLNKNTII